MIMLLDHLVRTLLSLLLFVEEHGDLGASFGLVDAKPLGQLDQRLKDQLTHLFDLSHRLKTYWDKNQDQHDAYRCQDY